MQRDSDTRPFSHSDNGDRVAARWMIRRIRPRFPLFSEQLIQSCSYRGRGISRSWESPSLTLSLIPPAPVFVFKKPPASSSDGRRFWCPADRSHACPSKPPQYPYIIFVWWRQQPRSTGLSSQPSWNQQPVDPWAWTHPEASRTPIGFWTPPWRRPGVFPFHPHSFSTNESVCLEAMIKHEASASTADPAYMQLLVMTQNLQQQIMVVNQQLAGL